jgi:hypothetical protein
MDVVKMGKMLGVAAAVPADEPGRPDALERYARRLLEGARTPSKARARARSPRRVD